MEKLHSLKLTKTNTAIFTAVFTLLAVVLPMVTHFFAGPAAGRLFLPMQLFVFLAALLLGWRAGLAVGILTPLISFSLTGMPMIAVLPIVVMETALYGFLAGYFHKSRNWNAFLSLFSAMILGRLILLAAISILPFKIPAVSYVVSALSAGLIGIAIQLILIPLLYKSLSKYIQE